MLNKRKIYSVCALLFVLSSCTAKKQEQEETLVIVNVLNKELYDDCAINKSISVPFEEVEDYAKAHWDKEKTHIVFYCGNYKCTASGFCARQLREEGYKNVWAYEGGTAEWKHKGYPTTGVCLQTYLNDYEEPAIDEGAVHEEVDYVISAEQLQEKMNKFGLKN